MQASHLDMPPIEAFPKAHICTFKYYVGLMFFLEEDYQSAEENLMDAFQMCHQAAFRNRERILSYLIPCRLLTSRQLPRPEVLEPYPRLKQLYIPICQAIRTGNLAKYDAALAAGEEYFVKARTYLTLERGREICLRNLFRKVFLLGGFEEVKAKDGSTETVRRTRVPVDEFVSAVRCSLGDSEGVTERDEVECLLANLIFKVSSAYEAGSEGRLAYVFGAKHELTILAELCKGLHRTGAWDRCSEQGRSLSGR